MSGRKKVVNPNRSGVWKAIITDIVLTLKNNILYVQYTNPANYPPLEHSGLIFLKAGWQVHYFGVQSEGESSKLAFPEPLARRQAVWKHQPPGLKQKLHFAAFTVTALWRAMWQRPAWVYCSDPMSCPASWLIGRFTRCRVLYHEHDSPETGSPKSGVRNQTHGLRPPSSGSGPIFSFQRFLLWCRKRVGEGADLVVFPNQKRLEIFLQTTRRQRMSLCVNNCPRKEEVSISQPPEANGKLRILFHGSLSYNQPPPLLLDVMARLGQAVALTVVGYPVSGSHDCMELFQQKAGSLGLEKSVRYLGALPRHELMKVLKDSHVGLALFPLETDNVNLKHLTGASNKAFDYLASGLALLVSARPDWEEMYVQPGYGLACNPDDADSIAAQLRWFLEHPMETREMGERGRKRIVTEWNYESQFAPVLYIINREFNMNLQ